MFYRSPCDVRYVYIVERTSTANVRKTQGDTHMGRECVNEGINSEYGSFYFTLLTLKMS